MVVLGGGVLGGGCVAAEWQVDLLSGMVVLGMSVIGGRGTSCEGSAVTCVMCTTLRSTVTKSVL